MCGRYYRRSDKQRIAEAFHAGVPSDLVVPDWDYNVAPTTVQPVIRNDRETGDRELVLMRWGLVPLSARPCVPVPPAQTVQKP
jgi:putative SOS response-associated peptidase YedK